MPSDLNQTYLVTGGTGFLGSNLVRALVDRGDRVRVLDNNFRGSMQKIGKKYITKVKLIEADIRDRDAVLRATEGVDMVCHLAFINGTRFFYEIPQTVLDVGLKGTINTLEACIECGVKNYVFASSSEVYQTPPEIPTPENVACVIPDTLNARYSYGGAKMIGEILAFNYGRDNFDRTVVFRPHNVYGPDMGFEHVIPELVVRLRHASADSKGGKIALKIQGDGSETRSFNNIKDFITGLLLVIDRGVDRNIYNIGSNEELSIRELANIIARKMGVEIQIIPSQRRPGGTQRRCPDISKLQALGYKPRISIDKGLNQTIAWYTQQADKIHNWPDSL